MEREEIYRRSCRCGETWPGMAIDHRHLPRGERQWAPHPRAAQDLRGFEGRVRRQIHAGDGLDHIHSAQNVRAHPVAGREVPPTMIFGVADVIEGFAGDLPIAHTPGVQAAVRGPVTQSTQR